jgi:3-hydroxyisobutyrate dehydrogenase
MVDRRKVAFIGLGVMGYPMAGHLAAAGHDVTVYNRTAAKTEKWLAHHGGNDDDLRAVVLGDDGAFAGLASGAVYVDHTTVSADIARELAVLGLERGIGVLDAPVSGGQAGAENGALTVMVGGDADAFARAAPVMAAYGRSVVHLGEAGNGQLAKMVNQICIAGLVQGLSEGINFGRRAGLDMSKVIAVISKGAAQSWQMENRAETMIADTYEFGFAVDWMRKDLGIVLDEANRNGARLPVTALVDQFYAQVQARGGNRWDTSSLVHLLRHD